MNHRWLGLIGALSTALIACGGSSSLADDGGLSLDGDAGADASEASAPIACTSIQTQCDTRCVDLASDPNDCGVCNRVCPGASHASPGCTLSVCSLVCDQGWTDCNHNAWDGCEANLQTDPNNCGSCGNACANAETCSKGTCGSCAGGGTVCGGTCTDPSTDPSNCGMCGNVCAFPQTCISGTCTCPSGTPNLCGSTCTSLQTDVNNCGTCGHSCNGTGAQTCSSGACACNAGYSLCNGTCISTSNDPKNCGSCGHACAPGQVCNASTCACPSNAPTLCSSGCADLQNDPKNCGTCGNACTGATGTCTAGACVTTQVTLASGQTSPGAIALDNTYAYWVNDTSSGSVMRVAKTGGGVTTLVQESRPYALAVDATNVYFTDSGASVKKVPLGGASSSTVIAAQFAYGLALSGSTLVIGSGDLEATPTSGGPLTLLATGQNAPCAVAADANNAYWVTISGAVASVPITGGSVTTLRSGQGGITPVCAIWGGAGGPCYVGIAVDASNVYWADASAGTIASVRIGGGGLTTLATGQTSAASIAVAGGNVYWTTDTSSGTVMKVPVGGGGTPIAIATGQNYPWGIAVDDTYVYWTNSSSNTGGTVMKTLR